jgi:hypothetical protein
LQFVIDIPRHDFLYVRRGIDDHLIGMSWRS